MPLLNTFLGQLYREFLTGIDPRHEQIIAFGMRLVKNAEARLSRLTAQSRTCGRPGPPLLRSKGTAENGRDARIATKALTPDSMSTLRSSATEDEQCKG